MSDVSASAVAAGARQVAWRRLLVQALPWVLAIGVYFIAGGYLELATYALVMGLFALSLDLILGFAGVVTLGQAAFFGFGSYAAGIFAIHISPDPLLGLVFATVLTGLLGIVTGMAILHTQHLTMMMLTLAVASLIAEVANQARSLTGGDDGLTGIDIAPVFGLFKFDFMGRTGYFYVLAVVFVWSLVAWRIMASPFGRSLNGIRQHRGRMRAIGTPIWRRLVVAYGIAAAMAGTAGALIAQTTETVSLSSLSMLMSGTALVMVTLGGMRRIYGAFVGAAVYVTAQSFAAQVDPFRWMFVIGFMLIFVVLFLQDGLMSFGTLTNKLFRSKDKERK